MDSMIIEILGFGVYKILVIYFTILFCIIFTALTIAFLIAIIKGSRL